MSSKRRLFFIAGANGSGKTTLAKEFLQEERELVFLNADDIAYNISPNNIEKVKISAAKELYKRLDILFEEKSSIAIETTLSGNNYIKIIDKAKKLNYYTVIVYSFVDNPQICINRIKFRVLKGGHDVPEEDVRRRFFRSRFNFWYKYKDLVEDWMLFYNGMSRYILVGKKEKDGINILDEDLYKMFIRNIK